MYKWMIDIYLKSGTKFECAYQGKEDNTHDVAAHLFGNKAPNDTLGFMSQEMYHNVFVVASEIAAFDIYV